MKTIKLNDVTMSELKDYVETTGLLRKAEYNHDYETSTYLRDELDFIARQITETLVKKLGYKI